MSILNRHVTLASEPQGIARRVCNVLPLGHIQATA